MSRADDFNGDDAHLIKCIDAFLNLTDDKAFIPHNLDKGSHAYRLLVAASHRLAHARTLQEQDAPDAWLLDGVPSSSPCFQAIGIKERVPLYAAPSTKPRHQPQAYSKEWCIKMAKLEGDSEIGAGVLHLEAQQPQADWLAEAREVLHSLASVEFFIRDDAFQDDDIVMISVGLVRRARAALEKLREAGHG